MTVLPQLETELLRAHERLGSRRAPGRLDAPGARPRLVGLRRAAPRINPGMVALTAAIAVTFGIAAVFLLGVHRPHASAVPAGRVGVPGTGRHVGEDGIDRALTRDFMILRRPLQPSDRLTGGLTQIASPGAPISGNSRPASLGLVPKLAREANLPGTRFRAWLIPGRHGLCWAAEYVAQVLGAFCTSFKNPATALTAAGGDASVKTATGLITIGLVTDRVLALTLTSPNGQRTPVPISEGFYTVDGLAGRRLIATTAKGSEVLPLPASELVLDTVGARNPIVSPPHQRGTLLAQIDLRSPGGDRTPHGIAQIYSSARGYSLSLKAAGVSASITHEAYAVWLYSTPHTARLLGFIGRRPGRAGTVSTSGVLPAGAGRYQEILVTLETQPNPKTPGRTILAGPVNLSPAHHK